MHVTPKKLVKLTQAMSQLYLHRLKVKQHSKHWLNFSLFGFFWLIFFLLRLIMFWRNFHSVFLFSVSKGYTSSVARSVSICFVSNFGFFDKHLVILAKQVLVALKIVVVFHQNIKRKQFFFTRRQPLPPVGRQHSSLPIPVLFSVFRLVQHQQLIPAFSCSEFREALGR